MGSDGDTGDGDAATGIIGVGNLLGLKPGPVDLGTFDPGATPGFDGGKSEGKKATKALGKELRDLQTKLTADGYTGGSRRLLLVLQGTDTSGKGGVLKHAVSLFNPGAVRIKSFEAPTEEELRHDFLWRVESEAPNPGKIGIFDRSHYEDVLIAKVRRLADDAEIERRYGAINDFEKRLVAEGTTVVKCMLHISADEQRDRLLARLDNPRKIWKFKPEDLDDRGLWPDFQHAYEIALERCNTDEAPWYVVPSNHKWYRTLAIASLLRDTLRAMNLQWPKPEFDVEEQKSLLLA